MNKKCIVLFIAVMAWGTIAFGADSADINGDSKVNLKDYAIFAEDFLKCTDPNDMACAENWGFISIGIVYGQYELLGYQPSECWNNLPIMISAGRADKLNIEDIATWSGELDKYNILLFTNLYDSGSSVNVAAYASQIRAWLQSNKAILIIEGAGMSGVDWLDDVDASLAVSANDRLAGLPTWVDPSLVQLHPLPDGWPADGFRAARISNPSVADFANGGINVPASGSVLAKNKLNRPTVWAAPFGQGHVLVTSYFYGYGLNELVFENIIKCCWDYYETSIAEPATIAEQVAAVEPITQTSPNVISFNSNGVMLIGSTPYFPWGFYSVKKTSTLTDMSANGFNFSNNWHSSLTTYPSIKANKEITWDNLSIRGEMITYVVKPQIVCWDALEEPSNTNFYLDSYWVKYRIAVAHKLDPRRPVNVLCNSPSDFEIYGPLADFAVVDPYCVYSATSNLDRIARDITDMRQITGKPVWALLQVSADTGTGLVLPSPDQLKSQMYTALAANAKGIFWFAMDSTGASGITFLRDDMGNYLEPQWSALIGLSAEYATIQPYLIAQSNDVSVISPSEGAYARRWTKSGAPEHLLVIVNPRYNSQTITINWPLATQNYSSLFGSPALTFSTGQISVALGGYKVGVYKFTN